MLVQRLDYKQNTEMEKASSVDHQSRWTAAAAVISYKIKNRLAWIFKSTGNEKSQIDRKYAAARIDLDILIDLTV